MFLEAQGNYQVIGEAADGEAGLALVETLTPTVVIMDLLLPKLHGLDMIQLIHEKSPETGIIVYSLSDAATYQNALQNGSTRFVSKAAPLEELLEAVEQIA